MIVWLLINLVKGEGKIKKFFNVKIKEIQESLCARVYVCGCGRIKEEKILKIASVICPNEISFLMLNKITIMWLEKKRKKRKTKENIKVIIY